MGAHGGGSRYRQISGGGSAPLRNPEFPPKLIRGRGINVMVQPAAAQQARQKSPSNRSRSGNVFGQSSVRPFPPAKIKVPVSEEPQSTGLNNPFAQLEVSKLSADSNRSSVRLVIGFLGGRAFHFDIENSQGHNPRYAQPLPFASFLHALKLSVLLGFAAATLATAGPAPGREKSPLRHRLALPLGGEPAAKQPGFDDTSWRTLDLPHDWSNRTTRLTRRRMARRMAAFLAWLGWYRKSFALLPVTAGRSVVVEFDGSI